MVCDTCQDTHRMTLRDQVVACTRCPVPCSSCRGGYSSAYCGDTPCRCACHGATDDVTNEQLLDLLRFGEDDVADLAIIALRAPKRFRGGIGYSDRRLDEDADRQRKARARCAEILKTWTREA